MVLGIFTNYLNRFSQAPYYRPPFTEKKCTQTVINTCPAIAGITQRLEGNPALADSDCSICCTAPFKTFHSQGIFTQ